LVVLVAFLAAFALEYVDRDYAQPVLVIAWVLFGLFWLVLIYPWFVEDESIVRGVGATIAAPLSLLLAKTIYEGEHDLFIISRAVTAMAIVYAPFVLIPPLNRQLIVLVTDQTAWLMSTLGWEPTVVTALSDVGVERSISGKEMDYQNSFVFFQGEQTITYTIILTCTGLGSMAVVTGLIAGVRAPIRRKVRALALAVPIIYGLNLIRNVFIAVSYGNQYTDFFPSTTMWLFSLDNSLRVSYIWADRIIAQGLSVVAMVVIIWLVIREVPEVMEPIEQVVYLATGEEIDLQGALNIDTVDGQPSD
jgi:archaeosortase A (PGF-CTERM-specific)